MPSDYNKPSPWEHKRDLAPGMPRWEDITHITHILLREDDKYCAHPATAGKVNLCTLGIENFEELSSEADFAYEQDMKVKQQIEYCGNKNKFWIGDSETERLLRDQFDLAYPTMREMTKIFIDCRGIADPAAVGADEKHKNHIG